MKLFLVLCIVIVLAAIVCSVRGMDVTTFVFTSWVSYPVYGLLALNFILCSIDRIRSRKKKLSFLLIHLGTLMIIGGASVGHFLSVKGYMLIPQQQASNRVEVQDPKTRKWELKEELPFTLYLDRFWIKYYPREEDAPAFAFVFEKDSETPMTPIIDLTLKDQNPIDGSFQDASLKVEEVIRNARIKEELHGDPELVVKIKGHETSSRFPVKEGETVEVEKANASFTIIKIFSNARVVKGGDLVESSASPTMPAIRIQVQEKGKEPFYKSIFSKMQMHAPKEDALYTVSYEAPDTSFSVARGKEGEAGYYAARMTFTHQDYTSTDWYFPDYPNSPYFKWHKDRFRVDLRMNPPQVEDYKSKLSVYENDELVESKVIEVNHPLSYKGYMFYQSDYDHEKNQYTILEVVKDPGMWWVFVGFALLTAGLIRKHYLNPILKRKEVNHG